MPIDEFFEFGNEFPDEELTEEQLAELEAEKDEEDD
jgi:hypothetical protein